MSIIELNEIILDEDLIVTMSDDELEKYLDSILSLNKDTYENY